MHTKKGTRKPAPTIAAQLKAARKKLGLSQSQAAEKWGVNVRTLQCWEQRSHQPRGLALKHLQDLLAKILKR